MADVTSRTLAARCDGVRMLFFVPSSNSVSSGPVLTQDIGRYGRAVRAGSAILLLNGSGNRDDGKFPDGDRFDITRTIDNHMACGYGLHFCLGAALALLEGRVALLEGRVALDEVLQRRSDERQHA
jgi:cytochrome P450